MNRAALLIRVNWRNIALRMSFRTPGAYARRVPCQQNRPSQFSLMCLAVKATLGKSILLLVPEGFAVTLV